MPSILRANNLVKKFGDITAVDDVSFEIYEGEIFSLLGPNGAGKTTTISMLSTLLAPTSGDAMINGFSIKKHNMQVRNYIGIVPQEIALYDDLTALENLYYWGRLYNLGGRALELRVAEVLEQIGLTDRAKDRIKTYSGGMKRRVNIAAGLLHKPRLLFMDEPTVGIDPQSRRMILDKVKELNQQGMAILYTTHYMEEAQELSNRVGIIDHGKLIAVGTQEELTKQVGEYDSIHILTDPMDDLSSIASKLQGFDGITRVTVDESGLNLITSDAGTNLAPIINEISRAGARIKSIEIIEPNLETVFLHLTGRALRD
ncbi:MAG TPA: ATP-binding cassette domain-containing protein [Anaerolineaceae bacterium]|nr:ATP-binding cassette domain-containing protein [Anaerolineaceae bacterium]